MSAPALDDQPLGAGRLIGFVGSYSDAGDASVPGGITSIAVTNGGAGLEVLHHQAEPAEAGYLVWSSSTRTLYAVDERKNDGRGPVGPAASVHALSAGPDGALTWLNALPAPAPFPTYLGLDDERHLLVCANHGSFEHVQRLVRRERGGWDIEHVYDDSAVLLYGLDADGRLDELKDVQVMTGHGKDPNFSLQAGGHGQASAHAHCATLDPTRQWVLVADKGTDQIHSYRLGETLELATTYQFPSEVGPRHVAFDADGHAYVTLEFASGLASMTFDAASGELALIDQVSTLDAGFDGPNEPADLRVHPSGSFVYVNNRGEDSLAWFEVGPDHSLARRGDVGLATSIHPGLAARSFVLDQAGTFMLVADRPANLVRSYRVDPSTGALSAQAELSVPSPAFIALDEEQP